MSLREKFAALIANAQQSVAYWRDIAINDFTRDVHHRMERSGLTHAELARRMGTSRPYVTKLLDGSNFTFETMVKLAMALDGVLRVHIADRDAITHWKDELPAEEPVTAAAGIATFGGLPRVKMRVSSDVIDEATKRAAHG